MLAFGLLALGAVVALILGGSWRRTGYCSFVFTAAASILLWVVAGKALVSGTVETRSWLAFSPLGASLVFRVDRLSAVFLLAVPFVGLAAMLYAVEYMNRVHSHHSPRLYYPFALLLIASIVGVVTTRDLFFFFIFWELMTLTSWVAVSFDREDETKARAAWYYFVFIHVATACLLAAVVILCASSRSLAFPQVIETLNGLARTNPALLHTILALFFIAFATKAGMYPLGAWLPEAHPAAPSPTSAVLSGAMIKAGVYGIARFFFEVGATPSVAVTWGGIVAVFGALSIFVGTIMALRQDDAKRVLSFHSTGQIGYMLLGLGAGLFFLRSSPAIASLAFMAGLYHMVNHACYKSLLFLNVGAVEYYTGTRDLNKLGGLGSLMPVTACAAVIASLSIAGIPPLNGFSSKWLIYQSTFQGGLTTPLFLLLGLVAMFISLVTLASFMKLLGSVFFGKQPDYGGKVTGDVPVTMRIPQVALALACVALGVAPILALTVLYGAALDVLGSAFVPAFSTMFGTNPSGMTLSFGGRVFGVWNPVVLVVVLAVCVVVATVVLKSARAASRETVSWYGGEEAEADEVRYKAHGFVLPFKQVFAKLCPPFPKIKIESIPFLRKALDFDRWLYNPLVKDGGRATDLISRSHSGVPQTYMLWQLIGVVAALIALAVLVR